MIRNYLMIGDHLMIGNHLMIREGSHQKGIRRLMSA